ncbi:MAG: carbohydrate kinase [Planctomycetes bacterium]|nr:carbohydrate kinase [Planctomycetota bacterium]
MIKLERLTTILEAFPRLTIGLVGDLFLDRYLEIEPGVEEYSIETGLEAYQVACVRNSPGALGTVMSNLAALGVGQMKPVTVVGDDGHGYDLVREFESLPVDTAHILRARDRLTPTYTKPLKQDADGQWRELNRLDVRTRSPLSDEMRAAVCEHLQDVLQNSDGLIVLDQIAEENQGVVGDQVRAALEQLASERSDKLIFVDSRQYLGRFHFGVLKGNQSEIIEASGGETIVEAAAARLTERTGRPVFCTLGESGLLVATLDGNVSRVPGYPVTGPIDIVGAGDSATAAIVMSLLAGANEIEAAAIGNLVASITVQQLGTTGTATPQQVIARWHETIA